MVLLAAAICSKDGKPLLSRQFVEMTRPRIEGLLAAFPKLVGTGKQHTFVETESVRYVYQPLDKLYVLLVTTKASNILEDLETLRLFARVIPEYSRGTQESDVINNTFEIMFAFDEIVALGYRENVNLAQIRTFTEMDSHEEREAKARREAQEREAKENMKRKAKELTQQRRDAAKRGITKPGYGGFGGGGGMSGEPMAESLNAYGGGSSMSSSSSMMNSSASSSAAAAAAAAARRPAHAGPNKAMKLGAKGRDFDGIAPLLQAEDPSIGRIPVPSATVAPTAGPSAGGKAAGGGAGVSGGAVHMEGVHCRIEEKVTLQANRDGGLKNMELLGILQVRVNQPDMAEVRLRLDAKEAANKGAQLQTHPNIDKQMFHTKSMIQAKAGGKPYPINQEVGVLKWRMQTQDEAAMPITINCWPNEAGASCEVNIEYELQDPNLELRDVAITIPLPHGNQSPLVNECEGTYECDSRNTRLIWRLPLVDADNRSGQLEFTIKGGHSDDFFPVSVAFNSQKSYCGVQVLEAASPQGQPVKFSSEVAFFPEKYEVA